MSRQSGICRGTEKHCFMLYQKGLGPFIFDQVKLLCIFCTHKCKIVNSWAKAPLSPPPVGNNQLPIALAAPWNQNPECHALRLSPCPPLPGHGSRASSF